MAIDPIAISILGLDIRWYGLVYALGFLFGYYYVMHFAKNAGLRKERAEDLYLYFMIFSVIGGRVFYILFYNLSSYLSDPLKIFYVWEGGMSIHGGILFGFLTIYYFSKKERIQLFKLTDLFVVPAALALAFGRIANFINQELVGKVTDSKFGIVFPNYDELKRHPVTLYESAKNMIAFQVLLYMHFFKELKPGVLSAIFLIMYAFGRFLTDIFRVPSSYLLGMPTGQVLNLVYGIIGLVLLYYILKKDKK